MRNFVYKGVRVRIQSYEALVYWSEGGSTHETRILCPENHLLFDTDEEADEYTEQIAKRWIDGHSVLTD